MIASQLFPFYRWQKISERENCIKVAQHTKGDAGNNTLNKLNVSLCFVVLQMP